ncbi:MAG: hypothetical protein AAGF54_03015 [Pseudomonadota bacterium]
MLKKITKSFASVWTKTKLEPETSDNPEAKENDKPQAGKDKVVVDIMTAVF